MKKSKYEKQRQRLDPLFKKWVGKLGLSAYDITVRYYDKPKAFRKENGVGKNAVMVITPDWAYLEADIAVCMSLVAGLDDDKLEKYVIHELCHILVNQMRGWRQQRTPDEIAHEERVVSCLATLFFNLDRATKKGYNEEKGKADERISTYHQS